VQTTGLLAADAVEKALAALPRFSCPMERMEVAKLVAIATACREAKNGKRSSPRPTHLRHQD